MQLRNDSLAFLPIQSVKGDLMDANLLNSLVFDIQEADLTFNSDTVILASRSGDVIPTFYPGQPISFTWQFWDSFGDALPGIHPVGNVIAKLLSDNRLTTLFQSAATPYQKGGVSEQVLNLSIPFAWFYKVGQETLRLQITASALQNNVFESSAELAIVPEEVSASWWNWTSLVGSAHFGRQQPQFYWKESYNITGRFLNLSQYATMSGTATLYEQEDGSSLKVPRGSLPFTTNPNGRIDLNFPPLTQSWTWLIPKVWVFTYNTTKAFNYFVTLNFNDQFGNPYSGINSEPLFVSVWVSDKKFALGMGAQAAAAVALILYFLSLFITSLPGSTALAVADGLGSAALDPPEADPKFRKRVRVVYPKVDDALMKHPKLSSLASVFQLCLRISTGSLLLSQIEGRLIGAREAKNKQGIELQTDHYREVLRTLMIDAATLGKTTIEAIDQLEKENIEDQPLIRKKVDEWSQKGIPAKDRRQLLKGGASEERIKQASDAARHPSIASEVLKGLSAQLITITSSLIKYASAMLRDSAETLSPKKKDNTPSTTEDDEK